MSDLFETRQKVEEGASWRGEITVAIDGEQHELTVRQLKDPEFWEVMSLIDNDELEELQNSLPEDKMEEFRELRDKEEDLTEEEESRLDALQTEIEESDVDMFEIISPETFEGIRQAAKYGVEPDAEDRRVAIAQHGDEIDEVYGRVTDDEAAKWLQTNMVEPMIDDATGFESFTIGIKCLTESIGDTGNSES